MQCVKKERGQLRLNINLPQQLPSRCRWSRRIWQSRWRGKLKKGTVMWMWNKSKMYLPTQKLLLKRRKMRKRNVNQANELIGTWKIQHAHQGLNNSIITIIKLRVKYPPNRNLRKNLAKERSFLEAEGKQKQQSILAKSHQQITTMHALMNSANVSIIQHICLYLCANPNTKQSPSQRHLSRQRMIIAAWKDQANQLHEYSFEHVESIQNCTQSQFLARRAFLMNRCR